MHQLHGSSVTYRIAVGPRQGRKVFTKYVKHSDAKQILQQAMLDSSSLYDLCSLLLDLISSVDDRYSFDQYLKSYGYHGYE